MGRRGTSSGAGGGKYSGTNAQGQARVFYDRTNQFAGMSMHEFENAIRSREEEKEAARRKLNPEMYDENGNLVLDDSDFFDRTEADMKRLYEEMKARGEAI